MTVPAVTPVVEKIRHNLSERFIALDSEKLTRFLMARASNKDLHITDCRGRRIGAGLGFRFEGQLRQIFWEMPAPCIESAVQNRCDDIEEAFRTYTPQQAESSLWHIEQLLIAFAHRIYGRMVSLDRRMRGNGDPNSVEPYDATKELVTATNTIQQKLAVLRTHYCEPSGGSKSAVGQIVSPKIRLAGIELDVSKAWQFVVTRMKR